MARIRSIVLVLLVTAAMTVIAYWMLFTTFMSYDDEGYVLISLKNYVAHGGLYSHVYSQYGPFLYLLHDIGHRLLGYEFTNTNGRLITLFFWVGAAMVCSHLIWRQTREISLTAFTGGLTFFYLWAMSSEPIHPGGLITALVAVGAWWGARQIQRSAITSLAIGSSLIGTALLFTKINVGVFFLISAGIWFFVEIRNARSPRVTAILAGILLVLLPLGLMKTEIAVPWVRTYAWLSIAASLTMLTTAWRERQSTTQWRHAGLAMVAVLLAGAGILTAVCLRGTSSSDMLAGILLDPLRHPGIYHYAPFWLGGAREVGGLSICLAVFAWKNKSASFRWIVIVVRLLLVTGVTFASFEFLPFTSQRWIMSFVVPLAWVFALRIGTDKDEMSPNIAPWLGLLLVLQYLHAYPVAGSQIAWGTFLIISLMALGLHDSKKFLVQRRQLVASISINLVLGALACLATIRLGIIGWQRYSESKPLRLPGAEDIRLPEEYASRLRLFSLNAAAHGDMLFSLPGMYSFNQWSNLPTPTLANTTHWFSLLHPEQQAEIISALAQSKRPVLIVQRDLVKYLTDKKFLVAGPLVDYLRDNFKPLFKLEKYEFLIRKDCSALPLDTAELLQLRKPQSGMAPNRLEIVAFVPPGSKVARIELATLDDSPRVLMHWDKSSNPLAETPINLRGAALAPEKDSVWETPLPPLVRLDLALDAPLSFVRRYSVVYLRDRDGALIAEARFTE